MKHITINHKNFTEIQVSVGRFNVSLLDLGATLKSINYKNDKGDDINALLEYSDIESYNNNDIFLGTTIGRSTGRIKYDESLFNKDIRNGGNNVLHGGTNTSAKKLWKYSIIENNNSISVAFTTRHEDDGFNDSLDTMVTYTIFEKEIIVKYESTPDGKSICNITNHAYFTLGQDNANDLVIKMKDSKIAIVDKEQLPNGEFITMPDSISVKDLDIMFPDTKGIDHPVKFNRVFNVESKDASVEISSTYDYVVLYSQSYESANKFARTKHKTKAGLAIEVQHIPNDPKLYTDKQTEVITYKFK